MFELWRVENCLSSCTRKKFHPICSIHEDFVAFKWALAPPRERVEGFKIYPFCILPWNTVGTSPLLPLRFAGQEGGVMF